MPRFRAMSPVRTDFGVHLLAVEVEDSASAAALFTAVVWSALHRGRAERVPKDHSLSMAEEAEGLWWQRQPETRLNFVTRRVARTSDTRLPPAPPGPLLRCGTPASPVAIRVLHSASPMEWMLGLGTAMNKRGPLRRKRERGRLKASG